MAKKKKAKPLTARELHERLESRYPLPEWVYLREVMNATGWSGSRTADAVSLSCYPSRGLRLLGFELKSSRADVTKELKDPDKAENVQQYCDLWYLVVGRSDLVSDDEVPANWGVIVPHGSGLRIRKEAPVLEPVGWPREFVASMLRNAHKGNFGEREIRKARSQAWQEAEAAYERDVEQWKERHRELERTVQKFEYAAGVSVRGWHSDEKAEEKGRKVRAALALDLSQYRRRIEAAARDLERAAGQMRAQLDRLGGTFPESP